NGDSFERIEPAHARGADEGPCAYGARVLHQLELRVLALGDDVLAVHVATSDQLGHSLHDRVVRANGVGREDVAVGHAERMGDGFRTCEKQLLLASGGLNGRGVRSNCNGHGYYSSPPATTGMLR